jgi:hypothetical protein
MIIKSSLSLIFKDKCLIGVANIVSCLNISIYSEIRDGETLNLLLSTEYNSFITASEIIRS